MVAGLGECAWCWEGVGLGLMMGCWEGVGSGLGWEREREGRGGMRVKGLSFFG